MLDMFTNIVCAIPAYNPDEKLIKLVESIKPFFSNIIIVNDGSKPETQVLFKQAEAMGCIVLHHEHNMGQGAAFKTALQHIETHYQQDEMLGVITADADGQHLPKDIVKLAQAFQSKPNNYFITVRQFTSNTPLRSAIGNKSISFFVKVLFGQNISDCQSGLRAIPFQYFQYYYQVSENCYNFLMALLVLLLKEKIPLQFLPIEAVYIDKNKSSHFRPIRDSYEIVKTLLKYYYQ